MLLKAAPFTSINSRLFYVFWFCMWFVCALVCFQVFIIIHVHCPFSKIHLKLTSHLELSHHWRVFSFVLSLSSLKFKRLTEIWQTPKTLHLLQLPVVHLRKRRRKTRGVNIWCLDVLLKPKKDDANERKSGQQSQWSCNKLRPRPHGDETETNLSLFQKSLPSTRKRWRRCSTYAGPVSGAVLLPQNTLKAANKTDDD